jgi:hypothetical protein
MALIAVFAAIWVIGASLCSGLQASPAWKQYPFILVPSDPERFTFPAAEAAHNTSESDSCLNWP